MRVLDGAGREVPPGVEGAICLRLPMPPGTLPTLWGDDQRYVDGYLSTFPGHYLTGDGGYLDDDGYLFVMGRTDDVINVAGHRLSTGGIEAALAGHPAVAECAVLGVADELKGQVPRALVVLKGGQEDLDPDVLAAELKQRVRDEVGPIASLQRVDVVPGPAQDPLGQDPPPHHARDGRRQAAGRAVDHRGRRACSTASRRCCGAGRDVALGRAGWRTSLQAEPTSRCPAGRAEAGPASGLRGGERAPSWARSAPGPPRRPGRVSSS